MLGDRFAEACISTMFSRKKGDLHTWISLEQ